MKDLSTLMYVFLGIDIFSIAVLFLMKKVGSNKIVYNAIGVYMFVLCILALTDVPSSNIVLKIIAGASFIPGVIGSMIREKDFEKGRILIAITIVIATGCLFMI